MGIDERELQLLANSLKIGMAVGGILSVIIVLFSQIADIPLLGFSVWAVYFSMYGSRHLYHFLKIKEKISLIQSIFGLAYFILMNSIGKCA